MQINTTFTIYLNKKVLVIWQFKLLLAKVVIQSVAFVLCMCLFIYLISLLSQNKMLGFMGENNLNT